MLKITITDQDILNSQTVDALVHLLYLLNQTDHMASEILADKRESLSFKQNQYKISKQDYTFICPQTEEIEPWVSLLKPEHQNFVNRLRKQGQLSLFEVADTLGIQPSSKNIKKHVNGSIGSILRWSKQAFLQQVYMGDLSNLKLEHIKLLPPWYCDRGIYYWRVIDRE